MFGFVAANPSALPRDRLERYRGCYCGLCRAIGRNYGPVQRLALNYDLTFLTMLLSALYEPEERDVSGRCLVHPARRQPGWQTAATDYAAAMNVLLAYYNCLDNWHDDRSLPALAEAGLFRRGAQQAAAAYPRQSRAIETCMQTLSRLENAGSQNPDAGANAFGLLMQELFVWRQDRWEPLLRQMGHALGQFIYLTDAVVDLEKDLKSGSYNPLQSRADGQDPRLRYRPILELYLGDCTRAFEQLPILQDLDILRNILYSGVWTRIFPPNPKEAKETHV